MTSLFYLLVAMVICFQSSAFAEGTPLVGRRAAAKYFEKRGPASQEDGYQSAEVGGSSSSTSSGSGPTDHYLALHVGRMMSSQTYEWGPGPQTDVGNYTAGVTYRVGEWKNSMDLNIRLDFIEYKIEGTTENRPLKLSLLPMVTFPDASSRFPLYFGFGMGPGVFFRQVENEASLSLDYQLIAGARFFDVFENAGFFIESGLKNHLQLWNSGQFNGTFLSAGAVFTF